MKRIFVWRQLELCVFMRVAPSTRIFYSFIRQEDFYMNDYYQKDFLSIKLKLGINCMSKVKQFFLEDEKIISCFTNDEDIAFFTDQRIIFIHNIPDDSLQSSNILWRFIPFKNISQYDVLTTDKNAFGRLELKLSEENICHFTFYRFSEAVEISKTIANHNRL